MNRYVIDGITRDAQAGKRVICAIPSREVQHIITRLERASGISLLRRSHGDERVMFTSGGGIIFVHPERGGGRGHSADIVVIDDVYYLDQMFRLHADLKAIVAAASGEIITYT
ncbi:Uncharacterised protein [Dermacoccus nishinomiyaensis]|nr:Uncharacterised protein [Dermacoccus nishinomiyaensis]